MKTKHKTKKIRETRPIKEAIPSNTNPLAYFLFFFTITSLLLYFFTFYPVKFALRLAIEAGFNRVNFLLSTSRASSPDAIAVRVIPNPEHYSPSRWYEEQGFTGSPQALTVDGYDAVRDGRTVYVNAANISGSNLYTNIYLISYNQDAESATFDIFSRLLSHWKFNTNITDPGVCASFAFNSCLSDSDCQNGYCNSPKAGIIRDTKRLSNLKNIETALENYKNTNGRYPDLSAGSYLPNKTISTWPSWQEQLGKELAVSLPTDPINKLGACAGYDSNTCWNEQASQFAGSLPDNLPEESKVMVYGAANNGASYTICAVMESGYLTDLNSQNACAQSQQTPLVLTKALVNSPPSLSGPTNFTIISGQPLNVFAGASDPNNDVLAWTINTSIIADWTLWSAAPSLSTSGVPSNQRKIIAANAGMPGTYSFSITVSDNRGGQDSQTYTITVLPGIPPVINSIPNQIYTIGKSVSNLTITAAEPDNQYPLTFNISGLPAGLSGQSADTNYSNGQDFIISGVPIDQTQTYAVALTVRDKFGTPTYANFQIIIINNPPVINTASLANATDCVNYTQNISINDPDGHNITFTATGLPNGLNINASSGQITGQPEVQAGSYPITITATDEYSNKTTPIANAQKSKDFILTVGDEVFSINPISNATIYGWQDNAILYYLPITYFGNADATTANSVIYTLTNNPVWLAIDSNTGEIQGTSLNNTPSLNTITVTATNACDATASTNFTLTVLVNEWCGDAVINSTEQCDDQNNTDGDGCSQTCAIESGWTCAGSPSSCNIICGDGIKMGTETCDDNNINNNDGCSSICAIESGWTCSGAPSTCQTICGDGIKAGAEQCDDGNTASGDGCNANCQNEAATACANGLASWWPGENNANDIKDGNNGTAQSSVSYVAGKIGQAFSFNGSSGYVSVADNTNIKMNSTTGISFGAWVYPDVSSQYGYIISKFTGVGQGYSLNYNSGNITAAGGNSGCSNNSTPVSYAVPDQIWTHAMVTISPGIPGTIRLYINGVEKKNENNAYVCNNTVELRIGKASVNSNGIDAFFDGRIDEPMFFNKELTAGEVQSIYNAEGFCGSASCKDILISNPSAPSGVYTINPDGAGAIAPFQVYCDMTTDGGGWTLAAKIASGNTWYYNSPYWIVSGNNFNDANFNLSSGEAKYKSFDTVGFSKILLVDPIDNKKTIYQINNTNLQYLFASSAVNTSVTVGDYDVGMFGWIGYDTSFNICTESNNATNYSNRILNTNVNVDDIYPYGITPTGFIRLGWWYSGSDSYIPVYTSDCGLGLGVKTIGYEGTKEESTTATGGFTSVWVK